MKATFKFLMAAAALSTAMAATPGNAAEIGWLDSVEVGWVDTAKGWVCMNEDALHTASYGSLDVYLDAPAEQGGFYYGNFQLDQNSYGYYKQGVTAAGYCGTDSYVGFVLSGWFEDQDQGPTKVYLYWRDPMAKITLIGGSPITIGDDVGTTESAPANGSGG